MEKIDKSKRSEIMRSVKSQGNKSTEEQFIKYLRNNKISGWRRKYKLVGKPDIVFPNNKVAIFLDGCFWHGHNCRNTRPSTNYSYWNEKIKNNRKRDKKVSKELRKNGWQVIRIWECAIKQHSSDDEFIKLLSSMGINSKNSIQQ